MPRVAAPLAGAGEAGSIWSQTDSFTINYKQPLASQKTGAILAGFADKDLFLVNKLTVKKVKNLFDWR